jgi:hypothetical protein
MQDSVFSLCKCPILNVYVYWKLIFLPKYTKNIVSILHWYRSWRSQMMHLHAGIYANFTLFVWYWVGWTIRLLGFDSWQGLGIFLFTIASRMALGPTQPPIQWIPGALSLGGKAARA